jgi:hypothetical protein
MAGILWTIITLLVLFWIIGLAVHIGGGLIHIAIVIAIILVAINLLTGRGARV